MARGPAFPYDVTTRISLWLSVLVASALFGWGAWQRRWIADDGLIVLRTVRNLLAGNGPVFNKGERVESNTSTLWTYLNYLGGLIAPSVRLEYVALWLALVLSVAGVAFLMLGAGRLYAPSLLGRRALLLPAGVLVYMAVPPARDFATSGLENGLVLAYLGLLWWMMVCWSQALRAYQDTTQRNAVSWFFDAALAFLAGLSVLVRPELALIGGLALVMMLIAARGWHRRTLIVIAGGLLPVAYQIFRMGYYGLLFPQTALAKDASGNKWAQGWVYLTNFDEPYLLWLPALLLAVLALVLLITRSRPWWIRRSAPPGYSRLARVVQSPPAVVMFITRQRSGAGRLLDPAGRRLHARQGPADADVLPARAGCGDTRAAAGRRKVQSGRRISARRVHLGAVARRRRLVAVGGQCAGDGSGRNPSHLHRHRRRTTVLLPGDRPRTPADGRGLSGLPADAGRAGRAQQHPGRCAAAAVGQLRPVGRRARETATARHAARVCEGPIWVRTQCFSPTSACSA